MPAPAISHHGIPLLTPPTARVRTGRRHRRSDIGGDTSRPSSRWDPVHTVHGCSDAERIGHAACTGSRGAR